MWVPGGSFIDGGSFIYVVNDKGYLLLASPLTTSIVCKSAKNIAIFVKIILTSGNLPGYQQKTQDIGKTGYQQKRLLFGSTFESPFELGQAICCSS